ACASACGSGGSPRRARGRGARKASRSYGGASSRGRYLRAAFSSSGRAAPDRHCFRGREPALRSLPSKGRYLRGALGITGQNPWKGVWKPRRVPIFHIMEATISENDPDSALRDRLADAVL